MRSSQWRARYLLVLASAVLANSGAAAREAVLSPTRFVDDEPPKTQAGSHGVVQGFLTATRTQRADPEALFVSLPDAAAGHVCLEMVAGDGGYVATADFGVAKSRGDYRLLLPHTRHSHRIGGYSARTLAALGFLAADCSPLATPTLYLPVRWGPAQGPASIVVLLNSRGATSIKVYDAATNQRLSDCEIASVDPALVTFDTYCSLSTGPAHGRTTLKIRRWVGEQEFEPPQAQFLLP